LTWTVQRVIDWSVDYLKKHEIEAPRLTTELLLTKALDCRRVDLYLRYEQPLIKDELSSFKELIKRRIRREPTQYILGTQEFWSLPLKVDHRVLIPRPETECLIEAVLEYIKEERLPADGAILELGTGSGAIPCALASELKESTIHTVDISPGALEVATENAVSCQVAERIHFYWGDLFTPVQPNGKPSPALPEKVSLETQPLPKQHFNLLISNPPYITSEELRGLQPEVVEYEPTLALDGGQDGLDFVRRILEQAPEYVLPGGSILIEIGAEQGASSQHLAAEMGMYESIEILKDYAGKDRILSCRLVESTDA